MVGGKRPGEREVNREMTNAMGAQIAKGKIRKVRNDGGRATISR
jgi:hypothetical protein